MTDETPQKSRTGRKPLPSAHKRKDQFTLSLSSFERERLNTLMKLGRYATAPEAVRAAVEEVASRLEAEEAQQPTAKAKP